MEKLKIRGVKESDLKTLSKIYARAFSDPITKEIWTDKAAYEFLDYLFSNKKGISVLAELEGKIVGGLFTNIKPWWNGCYLFAEEMFVLPEMQKKGIASSMFKEVVKKATEKGVKNIGLITFKGDYQYEWYKRLGLKVKDLVYMSGNLKDIDKGLKII